MPTTETADAERQEVEARSPTRCRGIRSQRRRHLPGRAAEAGDARRRRGRAGLARDEAARLRAVRSASCDADGAQGDGERTLPVGALEARLGFDARRGRIRRQAFTARRRGAGRRAAGRRRCRRIRRYVQRRPR
ncbi:MAG: hypothetical protein M0C28_23075 [Candidatus Moduliflexus flocculans]|nr:hypothetical protein [Candidatus Moduliflexus flocculans]